MEGFENIPLPKLPGTEFYNPLDLARPRPQVFKVVNGIAGNYGEVHSTIHETLPSLPWQLTRPSPLVSQYSVPPNFRPLSAPVRRKPLAEKSTNKKVTQPGWLVYDGQVSEAFGRLFDFARRGQELTSWRVDWLNHRAGSEILWMVQGNHHGEERGEVEGEEVRSLLLLGG